MCNWGAPPLVDEMPANLPHLTPERKRLHGALYEWPVAQTSRPFRGAVVEVGRYAAGSHAQVFREVLNALARGTIEQAGTEPRGNVRRLPEFDLVTFPEAFLPLADLVETLRSYSRAALAGFVHVGLRRDIHKNRRTPAARS